MPINPLKLAAAHGFTPLKYQILAQREGRLVARVQTNKGIITVKADAEPNALEPELSNNQRLAAAGLPLPEVIAHGEGDISYILLTWIEGSALSSRMPKTVQREAGALLRRVHAIGGEPPYAGSSSWDAWMEGWLHHALHWQQQQAQISDATVTEAWAGFEALRPLLAERGKEFILFDGRPEHFIIQRANVAGIIDVAEARAGDAAMDFGVIAVNDPALLQDMLEGYEPTPEERVTFDTLVPFYVFLRRLAAAEWDVAHGDGSVAKRLFRLVEDEPFPN